MDKFSIEIDQLMVKLINMYESLAKEPRDYGIDEKLLAADIHMIEFVGSNPDHNVTDLTELCGLTKGTISKRLSRLESMGYLKYYHRDDNNKEKYYSLTDKGEMAFRGHYLFHEEKNRILNEELRKYTKEEKEVIVDFLKKYNTYLKTVYK
ncbi:MAG: winged helix DNA-binding protein [Clostridiales bacterium]|nr:winged helix DNA-binding protein [Clostridiales bacterium]